MTFTSRSKVMDEELEAIQRVDRRERLQRARERRAKMSKVNLNVTREPEDSYEEDLCFYEKMFEGEIKNCCPSSDEDDERSARASEAIYVNVILCLHKGLYFSHISPFIQCNTLCFNLTWPLYF